MECQRGWTTESHAGRVRHFGHFRSHDIAANSRTFTTSSPMPLSLNLRHDLARMSDAQLAERLERIWQMYSQARAEASPYRLMASFRGPIRHPLVYPFLSWMAIRLGITFHFGPSFWLSIGSLLCKRGRTWMRMHLTLCEVRDITDEMKHRVANHSVRGGQ
jgi:hypothetical protein